MPTERQRREAAQRKLKRQLEHRAAAARKRRQQAIVASSAGAVLVVILVVVLIFVNVGSSGKNSAASTSASKSSSAPTSASASKSGSASKSASASPAATASPFPTRTFAASKRKPMVSSGACGYAETATSLKSPYDKDVGLPPDPRTTPASGTATVQITTSQGPMTLQLNRALAPCAVQSFLYLARKGFYDNTACPRLVTAGIFVLQCGDPSNSQQGGPTYAYKQETSSKTDYSAGVVAMANTGQPKSTGSQFFIIFKNSNAGKATGGGLQKAYSVIGTISKGLPVVTKVAAAGAVGTTPQATDGKPKLGLTVTSVKLAS